ncbi:hypothetical protein BH09BAC4_BH09BAC4_39890 [soil metagenome]
MIVPRLLRLLALFLGIAFSVQAQSLRTMPLSAVGIDNAKRWVVKFTPLSLFDPNNTIQFGLERLLSQRHSIQVEIGYGWQGMNLWDMSQHGQYSHLENWRGRVEWRYYWRGGFIGPYLALEGLYRQANAFENGTIGLGCETGQCQYYQLYSLPISKYVWGGHIKFGRQFAISTNKRLVGDFYGGLGIRGNTVDRFSRPVGALDFRSSGGFLSIDPFTSSANVFISVSYGIKIGYSF